MLIPGCSYSYKEHSADPPKGPEATRKAMEECGCRRCQNALDPGPEKTETGPPDNFPDEIVWRGITLKRYNKEDKTLAHWQCEYWIVWVDLFSPAKPRSLRWFACWQVSGVTASSTTDPRWVCHDSAQNALEACLKDLKQTVVAETARMKDLVKKLGESLNGIWAANRELSNMGEHECEKSTSPEPPETSGVGF